ncbi:MAG: hypothetical protein Kow0089_11990 [Desulfobulbaceae bacterium]
MHFAADVDMVFMNLSGGDKKGDPEGFLDGPSIHPDIVGMITDQVADVAGGVGSWADTVVPGKHTVGHGKQGTFQEM